MLRYPTNNNAFDARDVISHSLYSELDMYSPRKDIAVSFRPMDIESRMRVPHDFSVIEGVPPVTLIYVSSPPLSVITQARGRLNRHEPDFFSVLANADLCKLNEPNDDVDFVGDMVFKLSAKESSISTVRVVSKEKYVPVLDDDDYWEE